MPVKKKVRRGGAPASRQEPTPWYTQVKKELDLRDRLCHQRDPNDVYKRPEINPYSYKSVEEFKKRHPFNKVKDCKYKMPGEVDVAKDPYDRLYKEVSRKKDCDVLGGVWQADGINRKYRYEDGVCWKNPRTAYCSKHEVKALLRHGHDPASGIHKDALMAQGAKKCGADPKCTWVKLKTSGDCFDVDTANKIKRRVTSPPEEMPADITGDRGGIEQFLYDFYARGEVRDPKATHLKIMKPVIPPATTPLEGTGNRCAATQQGGHDGMHRYAHDEEIDIYGMPIKRKEDKRMKIPTADEKVNVGDELPAMLPSIVQSVINMVTKNWALKEAKGEAVTNRGLLAWAGTGSGKSCTAAGVMDAFWKSKRDIIFATSLDALASNPPSNFQECLYNLYPEWQGGKIPGGDQAEKGKDQALRAIAEAFDERKVRFLSFAKLSNRIKKTIESGVLRKMGGGAGRKAVTSKGNKTAKKAVTSKRNEKKESKGKVTTKKPVSKTSKKKAVLEDGLLDKIKRVLGVNKTVATKKRAAPAKAVAKIADEDVIDLNNTVLIIDEVHNLFRPLPTQRVQHEYLKSQLLDPTKWPGLRIVILTATPGDSIEDVLMLLNMIRDPTHPEIRAPRIDSVESISRFKDDVRGLISYFDMSSDRTRFPVVSEEEHTVMPMDPVQFEKYVEAYLKTVKEKKAIDYGKLAKDNMLNKYWAPARKYSNMLYTFDKGMKVAEFSSKLPALLEKIRGYEHEKHYVYSAFSDNRNKGWSSQGILAIANMMERELGYTKFSLDMAKFDGNGRVVGLPPKGVKRYLLVTLKELGGDSSEPGKVSKAAGEKLKRMLKVYNHPENRYGEIVHVMLASNAFNEGIDLKAVRHIHFFEPLVTMASDKQTIGRAARFCSHADLDKDNGEWTVSVHRYMSYYPVNIQLTKSGNARMVDKISGPTEDEKEKIGRLEGRIAADRQGLAEVEKALEGLKAVTAKSKDEVAKSRKEELKQKQKLVKEEIKRNEGVLKLIRKGVEARDKASVAPAARRRKGSVLKAVDTDNIKMIDEMIFQESRERVKELLVVYQCMKEAAVDCRLLQKFHSLSGHNKYACEAYERKNKSGVAGEPSSKFGDKVNRFFLGGMGRTGIH